MLALIPFSEVFRKYNFIINHSSTAVSFKIDKGYIFPLSSRYFGHTYILFYLHWLFIFWISSKLMYRPWIDSLSLKSFGFWWGSIGYAYKMPTYHDWYFSSEDRKMRCHVTFLIFLLFIHLCLLLICISGCQPHKKFQEHQLCLQGSTKFHWFPEQLDIIWWAGCGIQSWKYLSIQPLMISYDKYILIGIKLIIHFPLHRIIHP